MYRFIHETFNRLLDELTFSKTRYLFPSFKLRNRLTGLVGARGVGKTTLLLQYIKQNLSKESCFYFSADLVYFQQTSLLEFVADLHRLEGYSVIFIDEIHKYSGWNQELKNLYDAFPSLKIVFSGSSMLDLVGGSHDLSRRAKMYHLYGLSFREYLNFTLDLDLQPIAYMDLLKAPEQCLACVNNVAKILTHFENYLQMGYYPFFFEDPHSYYEKLSRIVEKAIYEDIASYYTLKTSNLSYFKRILTYLASIPPGDMNTHNLAKHLAIDHKTAEHYLSMLVSVGLLREMRPFEGGSVGLRRPVKILLNHTNLMHALQEYLGRPVVKGTERELFFIQSLQNAQISLFCSKQGDYRTRDALFEIGGKNKTREQIKDAREPAYLVKDEILHPLKGEIPLFLFGFLY